MFAQRYAQEAAGAHEVDMQEYLRLYQGCPRLLAEASIDFDNNMEDYHDGWTD